MTTEDVKSIRGIDIPSAGSLTPVRTGREADTGGSVCCPSGVICSRGTVSVSSGETLLDVKAHVFHSDPGPNPGDPPGNAILYDPPNPPGDKFYFDDDHNNEIPGVHCGNENNPATDNWLVIWARVQTNRKGAEAIETQTYKTQVRGVCDKETECEKLSRP